MTRFKFIIDRKDGNTSGIPSLLQNCNQDHVRRRPSCYRICFLFRTWSTNKHSHPSWHPVFDTSSSRYGTNWRAFHRYVIPSIPLANLPLGFQLLQFHPRIGRKRSLFVRRSWKKLRKRPRYGNGNIMRGRVKAKRNGR